MKAALTNQKEWFGRLTPLSLDFAVASI